MSWILMWPQKEYLDSEMQYELARRQADLDEASLLFDTPLLDQFPAHDAYASVAAEQPSRVDVAFSTPPPKPAPQSHHHTPHMQQQHPNPAPATVSPHFKTQLCQFYSSGACRKGAECDFAHGNGELRKLKFPQVCSAVVLV